MKNYFDYDMVDFLLDDSFIEWAKGESLHNQRFWTLWPEKFPHKAEVYQQSLEIASNLKIAPVVGSTHLVLSDLIIQLSNNKTIIYMNLDLICQAFETNYDIVVIKGNRHN